MSSVKHKFFVRCLYEQLRQDNESLDESRRAVLALAASAFDAAVSGHGAHTLSVLRGCLQAAALIGLPRDRITTIARMHYEAKEIIRKRYAN